MPGERFDHKVSCSRSGTFRGLLAALVTALAMTGAPVHALRITEIHYHPHENDDAGLEFVEIFNDSSIAIELSGFYFADGIEYAFPEGTFLESRAYLVVCADVDAVKARYEIENAVGNFSGRLANEGERITLVNHVGSPMTSVRYRNDEGWPAGADGTGYTLVLRDAFSFSADSENWIRSSQPGGTPGYENFPAPLPLYTEIFPEGGAWKFRKGFDESTRMPAEFSDPKEAWYGVGFDDSAWAEITSPVGFGDDDFVTSLEDMRQNYFAFAIRATFTVGEEALDAMAGFVLRLRIDDGCVVYLNGEPVVLFNMREVSSAAEVTAETRAARSRELGDEPTEFEIPKEKLRLGDNVLAIQVHNSSLNSNDAGVAVAGGYRTFRFFEPPHVPKFLINEVVSGAPEAERGVEIVNRLGMSMSLAGYQLTDDPRQPAKFTCPGGVEIGPRGLVAVSEADLGFSLAEENVSLFLYAPGGASLESAVAVANPVDLPAATHSHVRYPDGSDAWWVTETPTLGEANRIQVEDGIVINEIMYNPRIMGEDGRLLQDTEIGEYVELYNRSDRAISLDGFRLTSAIDFGFGPEHVLAPGGYLVVARNVDSIRETHGLAAGRVVGLSASASQEELDAFGSLSNQGETIRLRDPLGNTADEVTYSEEGEWDARADQGGSSLELIDPLQDNASPHAWSASDETADAPWTEITYTASAAHVGPGAPFSEMHIFLLSEGECLIDGVSITAGDTQYIANGDFEEDTKPWRLWGNHDLSFHTTGGAKFGQGSLHLVATGEGNNKVNRIEVTTSPSLPRGDITVTVWARWLTGSNGIHISGHNNAYGATAWLELPPRMGTPGQENDATAALREATGGANLGPVISKVRHSPAVPAGSSPIQFEARVTDSDGVDLVELVYEVDGSGEEQRLPLSRDLADDDRALGEMYTGELPGFADGTIINFRVEARDALGNSHVFPRTALDRSYSLIVDQPMESESFRYRMILNRAANGRLNGQLLHSNSPVPGTFVFEESEVYYDVGFRYHGSPWQRPGSPRMFRARFKGDHRFRGEIKRINLSRYGSEQREGTAYQLFRKASVPGAVVPYSARYEYYRLNFNTQAHGSMAEVRIVDKDYADFNWPEDSEGIGYKITGKLAFPSTGSAWDVDWTRFRLYRTGPYVGQDHGENARFYFHPKIRKDDDDFGPLIRLLQAMDRSTTPDDRYEEEIEKIMNVESWLRTFIIRVLQDDWDTIDIQNGQNAYLYYAPKEARFYLLPWDMDHTFANATATLVPTGGNTSGTGRLYSFPKYRRLYGTLVKEFIDDFWNVEYMTYWTDLVSKTTTGVAPGGAVTGFVRSRLAQVQSRLLRTATSATFEITTPDPAGVEGTVMRIEGTAPLEVRKFLVQVGNRAPQAADVTWASAARDAIPVDWAMEVTGLEPGRNEVEIVAFDKDGDVVASGALDVYNTSGIAPPTVSEVEPAGGPEAGGTRVRIFGSGFQEPLAVRIGGEEATEVSRVSEAEITAVTPPGASGPADVEVSILGSLSGVLEGGFTYGLVPGVPFVRGEVTGDGAVNLTDARAILDYLFRRGDLSCRDAADIDDDGRLTVSDPTRLMLHLFSGGAQPAAPFPAAGVDPTDDGLDCVE